MWTKEGSCIYCVKSAYEVLQGESVEVEGKLFSKLRSVKAPSGMIAFAWRVLMNKVQTILDLVRRDTLPSRVGIYCRFCLNDEESLSLFFRCAVA